MCANWYHGKHGAPSGPVAFEYLQQLARAGQLQPNDMVWNEGMPDWVAAETVPGLLPAPANPAIQAYAQTTIPFAQPVAYASPNMMMGEPKPAGFAVASLVLGILSVIGVCVFYVAPVLAILALIFGFVGKGRVRRQLASGAGMATAGIVCAFVSLGIDLAVIVIIAIIAASS